MSDDRKRLVAEVDSDAKDVLDEKLQHGELSEYVRDLVNTLAYGGGWDRQRAIDKQLKRKRDELNELRSQRRKIDADIEDIEDEIKQLEQDRDEIQTKEEQFEGALWSFEQSFRAGEIGHVDPEHGRLVSLAHEFDKQPSDVHNLLRQRNPDVPGYAFEEYEARSLRRGAQDHRFDGLDDSEVDAPVDSREPRGEGQ